MGQVHLNVGPMVGSMMTEHVPPFWHFCPPVLHGFWYWQYSPVYAEGHLKFEKKEIKWPSPRLSNWVSIYLNQFLQSHLYPISIKQIKQEEFKECTNEWENVATDFEMSVYSFSCSFPDRFTLGSYFIPFKTASPSSLFIDPHHINSWTYKKMSQHMLLLL